MNKYKLGIIGVGNMGQAILAGVVKNGLIDQQNIALFDVDDVKGMQAAEKYGVKFSALKDIINDCNAFLIAVKPQNMQELLDKIKDGISKKLIISVAAGVRITVIQKILGRVPVVRCMPNTPVLVLMGITAISASNECSSEQVHFVKEIFSKTGKVIEVSEKDLDAVTAISGSGPAYFFEFTRLLAKAGENLGLDPYVAQELAVETLKGSAKLISESSKSLVELRDMVTSKGGTTEAALQYFSENSRLEKTILKAAKKAFARSIELSSSSSA